MTHSTSPNPHPPPTMSNNTPALSQHSNRIPPKLEAMPAEILWKIHGFTESETIISIASPEYMEYACPPLLLVNRDMYSKLRDYFNFIDPTDPDSDRKANETFRLVEVNMPRAPFFPTSAIFKFELPCDSPINAYTAPVDSDDWDEAREMEGDCFKKWYDFRFSKEMAWNVRHLRLRAPLGMDLGSPDLLEFVPRSFHKLETVEFEIIVYKQEDDDVSIFDVDRVEAEIKRTKARFSRLPEKLESFARQYAVDRPQSPRVRIPVIDLKFTLREIHIPDGIDHPPKSALFEGDDPPIRAIALGFNCPLLHRYLKERQDSEDLHFKGEPENAAVLENVRRYTFRSISEYDFDRSLRDSCTMTERKLRFIQNMCKKPPVGAHAATGMGIVVNLITNTRGRSDQIRQMYRILGF